MFALAMSNAMPKTGWAIPANEEDCGNRMLPLAGTTLSSQNGVALMKEHNAHWQWFTSNAILEWTKAVIFVVLTAFTIPQYSHYDGAWDLPIVWLCTKWIQHGKQAVPRKDCGNTQQKQGICSKCELYCVEKVIKLVRGYAINAHEGGKLLEICTRDCCLAVQMRRTLSPAVSFHRLFASVPRFVHSALQAVVHEHCCSHTFATVWAQVVKKDKFFCNLQRWLQVDSKLSLGQLHRVILQGNADVHLIGDTGVVPRAEHFCTLQFNRRFM